MSYYTAVLILSGVAFIAGMVLVVQAIRRMR